MLSILLDSVRLPSNMTFGIKESTIMVRMLHFIFFTEVNIFFFLFSSIWSLRIYFIVSMCNFLFTGDVGILYRPLLVIFNSFFVNCPVISFVHCFIAWVVILKTNWNPLYILQVDFFPFNYVIIKAIMHYSCILIWPVLCLAEYIQWLHLTYTTLESIKVLVEKD